MFLEQNISVVSLVLRTSLFLLFNDKKMNENTWTKMQVNWFQYISAFGIAPHRYRGRNHSKEWKNSEKVKCFLKILLFCYLYKTNCWYNFIFRKYYLDALYVPNCSTSILTLHPLDSWHSLLSSPRSKNGELNLKKSHMSVGEWIKNE